MSVYKVFALATNEKQAEYWAVLIKSELNIPTYVECVEEK